MLANNNASSLSPTGQCPQGTLTDTGSERRCSSSFTSAAPIERTISTTSNTNSIAGSNSASTYTPGYGSAQSSYRSDSLCIISKEKISTILVDPSNPNTPPSTHSVVTEPGGTVLPAATGAAPIAGAGGGSSPGAGDDEESRKMSIGSGLSFGTQFSESNISMCSKGGGGGEDTLSELEEEIMQSSPVRRAKVFSQTDNLHDAPVVTVGKARKVRQNGVKKINRYVVLDLLGRGAYSKVKLCQHEVDGTYYAMKILSRSVLKSRGIGATSGLHKFRREVAILKQLRHPQIIALQEVIDDPSSEKLYLILELAEGRELVTLDDQNAVEPDEDGVNKIPEGATQRLAAGLVDAVAHAHELGIAHRDIKPQNILLTQNSIPKLSDFGVSAIIDDSPLVTCTEGTMAFLPPELLELATSTGRSFAESDDDVSVPSWQGSFAAAPRSGSSAAIVVPPLPPGDPVSNPLSPLLGGSKSSFERQDSIPPIVDLFKGDVWSLTLSFFVVATGGHPWSEATSGETLLESIRRRPMQTIIAEVREMNKRGKGKPSFFLTPEFLDFLDRGMKIDPTERMTIFEARDHPWIRKTKLARLSTSPNPEAGVSVTTPPSLSRVHSSMNLDEDDVANAVSLGQVHREFRDDDAPTTPMGSPLRSIYLRRVPCYSNLQFAGIAEEKVEGVQSFGGQKSFAFDDSCIVTMRPEQLESHLLQLCLSGAPSLVASPHATRPPSPTHQDRKEGGSPVQMYPSPMGVLSPPPQAQEVDQQDVPSPLTPSSSATPLTGSSSPNHHGPWRKHSRTRSLPTVSRTSPNFQLEVVEFHTPSRQSSQSQSPCSTHVKGALQLEAPEGGSSSTFANTAGGGGSGSEDNSPTKVGGTGPRVLNLPPPAAGVARTTSAYAFFSSSENNSPISPPSRGTPPQQATAVTANPNPEHQQQQQVPVSGTAPVVLGAEEEVQEWRRYFSSHSHSPDNQK